MSYFVEDLLCGDGIDARHHAFGLELLQLIETLSIDVLLDFLDLQHVLLFHRLSAKHSQAIVNLRKALLHLSRLFLAVWQTDVFDVSFQRHGYLMVQD
jgi:hypothetical protein